jgi:hypothetical protein
MHLRIGRWEDDARTRHDASFATESEPTGEEPSRI